MVCPRCLTSVALILSNNALAVKYIHLGEVELLTNPTEIQLQLLAQDLLNDGFELLDDRKTKLIEQIKNLLIQKVQSGTIEAHFSIIKFIGEHIFRDYSSVSKLFSEVEGITLEQFFNLQKIEKVKEWLIYNEKSLTQIGFDLGYSSTQHLSAQFKKLTGMTPTLLKQVGAMHRKPIDNIRG